MRGPSRWPMLRAMTRWSTAQIPDQSGRVAVVTGANSGIGYETGLALAAKGAHVVLACRDEQRGAEALARLEATRPSGSAELAALDLADLSSVSAFAETFRQRHDRLDLLLNNAGIMMVPHSRTVDGFERQLGTNHLGHFALTGRLLDRLLDTDSSRVVTVSSIAHRGARMRFEDLMSDRLSYDPGAAYGQSKLANLLFAFELQRRLTASGASTQSLAAHPGVSATNLGDHLMDRWFLKPIAALVPLLVQNSAAGALPTLRAAVDPALSGGDYIGPDRFRETRGAPVRVTAEPQARDAEDAARLWAISEELTGVSYQALPAA